MSSTSTQQKPGAGSKLKSRPGNEESMSPRKMGIIAIVTVVGCIAILWPKVFHPMMFGGTPPKPIYKDPQQRAGPGGCCDVVLDREEFMNASKPAAEPFGPHLYRKQVNLYTGEISLRQERPAHLHPESIYQAMRERGRAIPATPTVPIVERKTSPSNPPPRIVDGRPGPIPGMRPPMGAGALHQPQQRGGSSMGFLMPLYTIGIVVFFGYTIMKIVFKKQVPNAPYGPAPSDPSFRQEVFGQQNHSQVEDLGGTKLVVTAIQGLIDAADEQLNVRDVHNSRIETDTDIETETEKQTDLNKQHDNENTNLTNVENQNISNGHTITDQDQEKDKDKAKAQPRKRRDISAEREVTSNKLEENLPEPQSIYLEGALAHDSQILVADSQTKREEVYDSELNGSEEEPAVILSSKMTLSLINLDANQQNGSENKQEIESPLADDIEIIGHDEH
ncbi:resistance to inhibitors of cholinesterase protein 3 isoform X7 [Drosophila sulfurigaster albostrigata]|uniref:resistance to inhibitors of cholinesterase protein 3 isoform X7 n=1 Tax=Drosophila sulfurigaster albostrigata TaxID=89887 RepID=UPI002D21ABC3|nr:resistance to inhibitors of cholinesterase protein 3 isoform X7 [Drosophila sulfurigaster albostrigata]